MLNRRLWILFFAFMLVFTALAVRLAKLQFADAHSARIEVARFLHPQADIESYRGPILDRNGLVLARDVASDELAIDYRALSLDDDWLDNLAARRLRENNQLPAANTGSQKAERRLRIDEEKARLADAIDTLPEKIAHVFAQADGVSESVELERIHRRFSEISARIFAIREDVWTRRYKKEAAQASSTGDTEVDVDDKTLDERFRKIQLTDENSAHTVRSDLSPSLALFFRQHAAEFPGLLVRDMAQNNRRDYPFGEATAHVVGTTRSVDGPTLKDRPFRKPNLMASLLNPETLPFKETDISAGLAGYLPGDSMGETGVEKLAEPQLRGVRGEQLLDLTNRDVASPTAPPRIDPIPGQNVRLTIDAALQKDIYDSLRDPTKQLLLGSDEKEHFVAMVVMNMNGEILALISYPSYDPNKIDDNRTAWMNDTYRFPMLNRAISATYNPGSTIKPLLATAALSEHVITATETITCNGRLYPNLDILKCDKKDGHGPLELVDAIAKSCNVYFYTVGGRMGMDRLVKWYGDYGFGHDTGMELWEARGNLPKPDRIDKDADNAKSILMGIGQGPIDVTPLQMANAYATMLRGGVAKPPHILMSTPATQYQAVNISPQTLATVRQGMEQVTTIGTAKEMFRNFKLRVAGKTGTAEKYRGVFDIDGNPIEDPSKPLIRGGKPAFKPDGTPQYRQQVELGNDAWFVGYAPADKPQYVVTAIMEWGGFGGVRAAPMVKEAFIQLERHKYLPALDVEAKRDVIR